MQAMVKKTSSKMKAVKYIISVLIIVVIAYNAVYFKKLDDVKASKQSKEFNAAAYAQNFWSARLMPNLDKAIDINKLVTALSAEPEKTFDNYSHALGIGNLRYFLVSGKAMVNEINEDNIMITALGDSSKTNMSIATEFIFGNAVRDATGLININEFNNTMDFNNVSAELNKIIRRKVLPAIKQQIKKGSEITFTGAIELNKEHLDLSHIEVIPVDMKVK